MPEPSIQIRVGARFTRAVHSVGDHELTFRVLPLSPVLLAAAQGEAARASGVAAARLVRAAARQVAERSSLASLAGLGCPVVGIGQVARQVIALAGPGCGAATVAQLQATTEALAVAWVGRQRQMSIQNVVDPLMIGAAILEATIDFLDVDRILVEGPASGLSQS